MNHILKIAFAAACVVFGVFAFQSDQRHMIGHGIAIIIFGLGYVISQWNKPMGAIERVFTWSFGASLLTGLLTYAITRYDQQMCGDAQTLPIFGIWLAGAALICAVSTLILRLSHEPARIDRPNTGKIKDHTKDMALAVLFFVGMGLFASHIWECDPISIAAMGMFTISHAMIGLFFCFLAIPYVVQQKARGA